MLKVRVSTINAAYEGEMKYPELISNLQGIIEQLREYKTTGIVRDTNGSQTGAWWMEEED